MPFYDYRAIDEGCLHCRDGFEVMHKRGDNVETCPECGTAVERLLNGVFIGKSQKLALKHLEKAGFTTYNRAGKGEYERTTGSEGPDAIVHK